MIIYSAAVIPDRSLNGIRKAWNIYEKLFQCPILELRLFKESLIQIINIGLQVTAVVKPHGLRVNVRFQGVICIGERAVYEFVVLVHTIALFFLIYAG